MGHILIARLMMLLVALSVSAGIKTEQYTVQEFIVLLGYLNQLSSLLPPFGQAINQLFAAYPDLKFVFGELANGHEIVDEHPNIPLPVVPGVAPLIEFKNVSFTYPPKKDEKIGLTVFKDLSFTVKPGETVAFVSASGAGKTTIFNLLYGYYKPNQGVIKINGKDISEVSLTSLQKNINLFGQTPDLFKGSIRDNILFGGENPTTITDDMIYNTAKAVDLYDFLQAFPDKLATDVGSEGKAISLGQRQKVSVLRGLMKQGVIRLLDEITAPFDNSSAQAVLQNLAKPSGVTTLMITHKLHEAQHVDKIFVLEDGRVVAEGTHQELLETSPHYQKLWADGNHDAEPMRSSSMSKITQALGGPVAQVQTSLATNSNSAPVNPTPKPISSSIDDDNDEYYFADKIALRR